MEEKEKESSTFVQNSIKEKKKANKIILFCNNNNFFHFDNHNYKFTI